MSARFRIIFLVSFISAVVLLWFFTQTKYSELYVEDVVVLIDSAKIVDHNALRQSMYDQYKGLRIDTLDLTNIENKIKKSIPYVQTVECYTSHDKLYADVTSKNIIARISYGVNEMKYIASDNTLLPTSEKFSLDVIMIHTKNIISSDKATDLISPILKHEFFSEIIRSVNVKQNHIELLTIDGLRMITTHEMLPKHLSIMERFLTRLSIENLKKIRKADFRFHNQVICE